MVAGAVTPPRLDIANQDLLEAHIHSVWLAEVGLDLGKSLKDLLDITGDEPTLKVLDYVQAALDSEEAKNRTLKRAKMILSRIEMISKRQNGIVTHGWKVCSIKFPRNSIWPVSDGVDFIEPRRVNRKPNRRSLMTWVARLQIVIRLEDCDKKLKANSRY